MSDYKGDFKAFLGCTYDRECSMEECWGFYPICKACHEIYCQRKIEEWV